MTNIFYYVLLISMIVKGAVSELQYDDVACLMESQIRDECFQSIDINNILKETQQTGVFLCTVMTIKLKDNLLNEGKISVFSDKAQVLCEKMAENNLISGYNLFEIYLVKNQLIKAFSIQYQLFFKDPFNHQKKLKEIIPKYQQILEHRQKSQKFQENKTPQNHIEELVSFTYLQKFEDAYNKLKETKISNQTSNIFLRIRILSQNSQYTEALNFLKEIKGSHWYIYHLQGIMEMHHLQFRRALMYFQESLRKKQDIRGFSFTPYNMGVCYQKIGEFQKSLNFLKRALLGDPNAAEILNSIGSAYFELMIQIPKSDEQKIQQYEQISSKYFKEAIKKDPSYSLSYYNYGTLHYNRGQYEEALKMFKKASEYKMNSESLKYSLFKTFWAIDSKKGIQYMQEHLLTGKQVVKDIGKLLYEVGEYEMAYKFFKQAETLNRDQDEIYEWKGIVQFHLDLINQAEQSFKKAITFGNTKATVYFNIGYIYRLKENYKESLKYLTKSYEKSQNEECLNQIKQIRAILQQQSQQL